MKERTLILLRHAHRDTDAGRERDNGLSEKGHAQAKAIAKYYRERFGKGSALLLSSPKVRCFETLAPLSEKLGVDTTVLDLLDEQNEGDSAFTRRVRKFHRWWLQRGPERVVACSHGDWIPLYCREVLGTSVDLKKGAWLELEAKGKVITLRWLLQRIE